MMSAPQGIGQMAALYAKAYRRTVRRQCWFAVGVIAGECLTAFLLFQIFKG